MITDREWKKIGHLQSVVGRRRKGSRNQGRAVRRLCRYRGRLVRRKHDALHKLTIGIVRRFRVCAIEELKIANMTRSARGTVGEPGRNVAQKAGLNRAIRDQCWGEFERQLKYKYAWYGGELLKVPAKHSSNECRACEQVDSDSRESQAVFRCRACGHEQHADVNAAEVVLARAERGEGDRLVGPSGGPPGRGETSPLAGNRNACAHRAPLKTPEALGPSRKNPARAGNTKVGLSRGA